MRISCTRDDLVKGLATVGPAVGRRTTLPIIGSVLVTAGAEGIQLQSTNLEMGIRTSLCGMIAESGGVAIPFALLESYVKLLPAGMLDIEGLDQHSVSIQCGKYSTKISGMAAQDFPPYPKMEDGATVVASPAVIKDGVRMVSIAVETGNVRPVLSGIHTEIEGDRLVMVAADGYRLAKFEGPLVEGCEKKVTAIIPAKALIEMTKVAHDDVTITLTGKMMFFSAGDVQMHCTLIQGTFPNYNALIPADCPVSIEVSTAELGRSVSMANIFASANIVRMHASPENGTPASLTLSSRGDGSDHSSEIEAKVNVAGKIALNARFVLELLKVIGSERVTLKLTEATKPAVFYPVDDDRYLQVIMPMFVQGL